MDGVCFWPDLNAVRKVVETLCFAMWLKVLIHRNLSCVIKSSVLYYSEQFELLSSVGGRWILFMSFNFVSSVSSDIPSYLVQVI